MNIIAIVASSMNLGYSREKDIMVILLCKEEVKVKKRMLSLLLGVLLILVSASIVLGEDRPLVPDFTLSTADGESVSLSDYKGKVVVLNFWASWCPPCRLEMPEFQKLHDETKEVGEVVLLLLNQIDGSRETVSVGSSYLEKNNYTMLNLLDYGQVGAGIFGIPGLPTTVVVDKEGYLSSYVVGATTKATVEKMIEGAK